MDNTSGAMLVDEAAPERSESRKTHLPGEVGIWIFVLGDLLIFALLFCIFIYYRQLDLATSIQSQAKLSVPIGFFNTLVLLTSSLSIARCLQFARSGMRERAMAHLTATLLLGLVFVVAKIFEYYLKFREDITPLVNDFFAFYFVMTAAHLIHVLLGIAALIFARRYFTKDRFNSRDLVGPEIIATFWHMVDLIWIILFPLLYLIA